MPRRSLASSSVAVSILWAFGDAIAISLMSVIADFAYNAGFLHSPVHLDDSMALGLTISTVFVAVAYLIGGYKLDKIIGSRRHLIRIGQAWVVTFLSVAWIGFLAKFSADVSRGSVLIVFVFGGAILLGLRGLGAKVLRNLIGRGRITFQRTYLVSNATQESTEALSKRMQASGLAVVAINRPSIKAVSNKADVRRWCRQVVADIRTALQEIHFDAVYVQIPWDDWHLITAMTKELQDIPLPIYLYAEARYARVLKSPNISVGEHIAYQVERGPLSTAEQFAKRMLDIVLSSVALIILSPVLTIVSLAILVTSGWPIIFRQARRGFGGRPFNVLKFRTMTVVENGENVPQACSSSGPMSLN